MSQFGKTIELDGLMLLAERNFLIFKNIDVKCRPSIFTHCLMDLKLENQMSHTHYQGGTAGNNITAHRLYALVGI